MPWNQLAFAAAFSAVATIAVYIASGPNLGLIIGALVVATLGSAAVPSRPASLVSIPATISLILFAAAIAEGWDILHWLFIATVIVSYTIAVAALRDLLHRLGAAHSIASATVVVIGLLWLSWPFWLAPHFNGSASAALASALAKPHPIFAINGSMSEIFPIPWPQHRIAYRLTNIGDDVPYEMPTTIAWTVLLHLGIGLGALVPSLISRQVRQRIHPPVDEPDAHQRQSKEHEVGQNL